MLLNINKGATMPSESRSAENMIKIDRLELCTLTPGTQILINLDSRGVFHAILVDPVSGQAVVRPWVGGGQQNAGYRDVLSTIGTRPYEEGAKPFTEPIGEQIVDWGGITFGDELVLRNEEGAKIMFTGQRVESVQV